MTSHGTDPDNPGWRWTTNANGLGGWLPEGLVEDGVARDSFDSRELTVLQGAYVTRLERCNAWSRCRNAAGVEGWVPDRCLAPNP